MSQSRANRGFQVVCAWLVAGVLALAVLLGLVSVLWAAMLRVEPDTARVGMLVATGLLPVALWTGWWFGRFEARGRLRGIDQAVDKVMDAATRAASLRVGTARAMRRAETPDPPVVLLPDLVIEPRQLAGGGDVVEL